MTRFKWRSTDFPQRQVAQDSRRSTEYTPKMWKTPDGQAHTVALPDPTSAMTQDFVDSLRALDADERTAFAALVEAAQEGFLDLLDDVEPTEPTSPDKDGLPSEYLEGSFESAEDIARYLNRMDIQWKLDALLAVEDYLADIESSEPGSWIRRLLNRFKT